MNLKSFIIRSERGIFTVTNVQTVRKVVYKPKSTERDNRWGEICYQGYGDQSKYQYAPDFSEVYQFVLVARYGKTETVISVLPNEQIGRRMEEYIWTSIQIDPKRRMIDLTSFNPNMLPVSVSTKI